MDPEPKTPGRTTCLVVSRSGARDETMLATMRSAGMHIHEVSRIEAQTVANHKPALVVTAGEDSSEILEIIVTCRSSPSRVSCSL